MNFRIKTLNLISKTMASRRRYLFISLSSIMLTSFALSAQETGRHQSWTFITRITASSVSDNSEPEGYQVYSSINLEVSVRREFNHFLAAELNIATQSREVDFTETDGDEISLGAIELLPINLLMQYHPSLGMLNPYLGAGINFTKIWEKSGTLNSKKFSNNTGLILQLGSDFNILPYATLNFEIKLIDMEVSFETPGDSDTKFELNPFSIGIGLGLRF